MRLKQHLASIPLTLCCVMSSPSPPPLYTQVPHVAAPQGTGRLRPLRPSSHTCSRAAPAARQHSAAAGPDAPAAHLSHHSRESLAHCRGPHENPLGTCLTLTLAPCTPTPALSCRPRTPLLTSATVSLTAARVSPALTLSRHTPGGPHSYPHLCLGGGDHRDVTPLVRPGLREPTGLSAGEWARV